MNITFLIIDIMLLLGNIFMCVTNYKIKNYKTALFSAFVSGFMTFCIFALVIRSINT